MRKTVHTCLLLLCFCLSHDIAYGKTGMQEPVEEAKTIYRQAMDAMNDQQYAVAAEYFDAAYALYPNHTLLWNSARTHHLAGHLKRAEKRYEQCLGEQAFSKKKRARIIELLMQVRLQQPDRRNLQKKKTASPKVSLKDLHTPAGGHKKSSEQPASSPRSAGKVSAKAETKTTFFPVPLSQRPLMLPKGMLATAGGVAMAYVPDASMAVGLALGLNYGVNEDIEVGANLVSLSLYPDQIYDLPSMYVLLGAHQGDYEVGGLAQFTYGVQPDSPSILTLGSPIVMVLSDTLRVDTGAFTDLLFFEDVVLNFRLPLKFIYNFHERVYGFVDTGWILPRYRFTAFTVPFSLGVGTTLTGDGGPFGDIYVKIYWPQFISFAADSGTNFSLFTTSLGARFYFPL